MLKFSLIFVSVLQASLLAGQYTSSRAFTSSMNSSLNTTVVNLHQPSISFSDADKQEVTRGYSFFINCSTKPQYPGGSFHLALNGSNIRTQPADNHSAVFLFPKADFVDQGNYSCTYEVKVSSSSFNSTASKSLFITVKASLIPYISAGGTAGLLLILVLVIILFVKKRKRGKFQVESKEDTQYPRTTRSLQGDAETDDDEADYENAEITLQQMEDSEDSDNDYVNVGGKQRSDMNNSYEHEDIYANCVA
ncbi:uncharacterized protein Hap1MRO34_018044 [Clarias gariepinus]|uniref:uncharacterized protein LOC128544328 n=1 Tax=Clarias gariepinus TaxID=13013 RepID=UPI00234D024F|nr:uncharacterized protein LOC128544328 [Clarias gariepinus]